MKQNGITQVSFRIDEILAKKFKSKCALQGEKMQDVLIRAVKMYMGLENAEKPE